MLAGLLSDPVRSAAVTDDVVRLVEAEVASKSGLSGAALKASFKAFVRIQPGIVRAAVVRLLPEMVPVLDRHWAAAGDRADAHFTQQRGAIADDLLGVTDAIAQRSSHRTVKALYGTLRSTAAAHVAEAVPKLPTLIRRHLA